MEDSVTSGLFGIVGILAGSAATFGTQLFIARSLSKRTLDAAAFRCLIRLEKIRFITAAPDGDGSKRRDEQEREKTLSDELHLLGEDLDSYMAAASSARRRVRNWHFAIQKLILPIVMQHNLSNLDRATESLEHVRCFGDPPEK